MRQEQGPKAQDLGFDLRTHHWNDRGQLERVEHYRMHSIRGKQYFERPVGSGNVFWKNNEPAGRISLKEGNPWVDERAAHIEFTPPPTGAELVTKQLRDADARVAALQAELDAIKNEKKFDAAEKNVAESQVAAKIKGK